jgi:hypothetical protein
MLNYEHICDLHILLKLAYILLLLKFVHVLIKFEQSRDVFVCDLMATIKVCRSYVYNMYDDQLSKFILIVFGLSNRYWS